MKRAAILLGCFVALSASGFGQIVMTPAIGGFTLGAGGCFTQPVTYAGAAVGSTAFTVNPETFPGNGVWWQVYVSATNQVTVKVCNSISGYVNAAIYDVQQSTSGSGFVTGVTASSPITSTGGVAPNIACPTCGTGTVTGVTGTSPIVSSGGTAPAISCPTCGTGTVTGVTGTSPIVSSGGATPALSCPTCTTGGVTAVTGTAPIVSSGGATPALSCPTCTTGGVTAVTGTAPIVSSGGATPALSCPTCTTGGVTAVTATGPITSSGGTTPNISATYQGTGGKVQASTGTTTTNDCVKFDANGNTIDSGAACGGSSQLQLVGTPSVGGTTGVIVLSTSTASISFTSIPQTPFNVLTLYACTFSSRGATADSLIVSLDGDTGANYNTEILNVAGNVISNPSQVTGTTGYVGSISAASSTAGRPGCIITDIVGYNTTTYQKYMQTRPSPFDAGGGGLQFQMVGTVWTNTAAVTSITINASNGNLVTGMFYLYAQ